MVKLSTETSKKRRLHVKLCKIRLYSFFSPASSPFIIVIIVITIIVVNIIFENITHQRQTGQRTDSQRDSQLKPQKQASAISTVPQHKKSKLYMSTSFWAKHFNKVSDVLIYNSLSFSASSPFSSQDF